MILDRIAIDEAGANPARQARAVLGQLGPLDGPVPVIEIARVLDITEIRVEPLRGLEAALITTPERDMGSVLLNADSSPQRQRFSLARELGHYLNPWHKPPSDAGFQCSQRDMTDTNAGKARTTHLRQEAEANRFAIELLAPAAMMKPFLRSAPDMEPILAAAQRMDISKAAAARRYVELHGDAIAIVFSRNGMMISYARSNGFPFLVPRIRGPIPALTVPAEGRVSSWEEAPAEDWLARSSGAQLSVTTLGQANGYAMTLLSMEGDEEDEME